MYCGSLHEVVKTMIILHSSQTSCRSEQLRLLLCLSFQLAIVMSETSALAATTLNHPLSFFSVIMSVALKIQVFLDVTPCLLVQLPMFVRSILLPSSGSISQHFMDRLTLKMETLRSSETSVTVNPLTRHNISQDLSLHQHCSENFKSRLSYYLEIVSYCRVGEKGVLRQFLSISGILRPAS